MEFFLSYGLFLAKIITSIIFIIIILLIIFNCTMRKQNKKGNLKITNLTEIYNTRQYIMKQAKMKNSDYKIWLKNYKKQEKIKAKKEKILLKKKQIIFKKPSLFVINFKGSINACEVSSLREEINTILSIADNNDEVLVKLESCGGVVHGYGLAAAQLNRLKEKGLKLTVSVDKVAASGGYMMASVANRIIAAPFAIIGSIGVVAQIPNFNRLLKKNNIDIELHTAGEHKRTLTIFGENTEHGRKKFINDLHETHKLFKDFIQNNRPNIDIDSIATGEYWYGKHALEKGLIDQLGVSDDIIINNINNYDIIEVVYTPNKKVINRILNNVMNTINKLPIFYTY
uniref:Protease SohB n=1 Tax=Candidatus Aschnera chinzeii TaxID=1485666 RepID=A0AAT9G4F5_9ENTR|nr:MAG: protease SohB [Candidatus Aschnera chinzeii]